MPEYTKEDIRIFLFDYETQNRYKYSETRVTKTFCERLKYHALQILLEKHERLIIKFV
jgi:hypothetical protein